MLKQFASLVFPPDYTVSATAPKRTNTSKATAGGSRAKKVKEVAEINVKEYVEKKMLSKLTVAGLKEICASLDLRTSGRKMDIIAQIEQHFQ